MPRVNLKELRLINKFKIKSKSGMKISKEVKVNNGNGKRMNSEDK